jgi:DNA-binding response OmpR family regulator
MRACCPACGGTGKVDPTRTILWRGWALTGCTAVWDGGEARLSRKEAAFLRALLLAKGAFVSPWAVLEFMFLGAPDADVPETLDTVRVRANRLRAKIGAQHIPRSDPEFGYRLLPRDALSTC